MMGDILSLETAEKLHKLEKENKKLRRISNERYKLYLKEKSKNEKAIEYIKQHCEIVRFEDKGVDMIGKVEGIPLLNILTDGTKE